MSVYQKARIFDPDSPTNVFYVQFNPNTLEYSASAGGQSQKGVSEKSGSGTQHVPDMQRSPVADERGALLSVRLFFHSYTSDTAFSDVRPSVNRIRAFLPVTSERRSTGSEATAASPKITFAWGTMTHTGTLESFQATYQMFACDGTPVQAEVAISIRGEDPDVSAESNNQGLSGESELSQEEDVLSSAELSWLFQ